MHKPEYFADEEPEPEPCPLCLIFGAALVVILLTFGSALAGYYLDPVYPTLASLRSCAP